MKVKEVEKQGLKRTYEIVIPASDIETRVEARLAEVGQNLKVPGFRPGKVPMQVLRSRYGDSVLGEVIEKAVNDSSNDTIDKNKLKPAMQPKIEIVSFDKGKDLAYKMELEIIPEFDVKDLKAIKLQKLVVTAGDKDVTDALERIAGQHKSSEPIKTKRAAKNGDVVVIDFDGECGGKRLPGMKAEGYTLELGSKSFVDNFEDQVVGKKAGDSFTVNVTFPDNYGNAELAGKPASFDVVLHEIRESKPVAIDDDLAKQVGMDKLDDLKKVIVEQIEKEYGNLSRMKLKRALLDAMDEQYDFDLPASMVEMEFSSIKRQAEFEKRQSEGAKADLTKDELEELEAIAERRVRLGLVLSEIGQANKITVTDQDLQRAVIAEAQKYPGQEAQVFDLFAKNRQMLQNLRAPVFEEKVVDYILTQVQVADKKSTVEELTADDDDVLPKKKSAAKKAPAKAEKAEKAEKPAAKKDAGDKAKGKAKK